MTKVRDDPKLINDTGEVPKPNWVVGGSILGCEIVSQFDIKTSQVVKRLLCSRKIKNMHDKEAFHFIIIPLKTINVMLLITSSVTIIFISDDDAV